jgi:peptidoglycan/LPS O-acetylase OafA/YrhL
LITRYNQSGLLIPSKTGLILESAPAYGLNGSLWSIPIEFWCYLGVLGFGLSRLNRAFLLGIFAVIIAAHVWTVANGKNWGGGAVGLIIGWPNTWFRMAPFFVAGMLFYDYRGSVPRSGYIAAVGLLSYEACAWLFPLAAAALLPAVLAYAVFYCAFSRQFFWAAKHGDFSYGAYLYAFPLQQLLLALTALTFPAFVTASMTLALMAGVASWFLVERWFHKPREPMPPPHGKKITADTPPHSA